MKDLLESFHLHWRLGHSDEAPGGIKSLQAGIWIGRWSCHRITGVVVCNLYMEDFERWASAAHPTRWWKRYVDDTHTESL